MGCSLVRENEKGRRSFRGGGRGWPGEFAGGRLFRFRGAAGDGAFAAFAAIESKGVVLLALRGGDDALAVGAASFGADVVPGGAALVGGAVVVRFDGYLAGAILALQGHQVARSGFLRVRKAGDGLAVFPAFDARFVGGEGDERADGGGG